MSLFVACQVVMYQGLAAVPLHFLLGRFKKSFFLHPTTYELYGRVGVRPRLAAHNSSAYAVCICRMLVRPAFCPPSVMLHPMLPSCMRGCGCMMPI